MPASGPIFPRPRTALPSVITPRIKEETGKSTNRYKEIIEEQSRKIQQQALAYTIMSNINDLDKKKIFLSIIKDLSKDNPNILQDIKRIFGEKADIEKIKEEIDSIQEKGIKGEDGQRIKEAIGVAVEEVVNILIIIQ